MAPETENSKIQAPRPAQPSGQTIHVPAPEAGAEIRIPASPSGVMEFAFDFQQATVSRDDDFNLVFVRDDGGRVVLEDFFIVGDESLPELKLPADGDNPDTVVASADFLEMAGIDISTAAGAPAAPPSSGSDGSGDPLGMTDGLDRLATQGTWFWGYENDDEEIVEGLERPDGGFGIGVFTATGDLQIGTVSGVYEDAQPYQHLYGQQDGPTNAGKIDMTFSPRGTSQVGAIVISGLPAGAQLWLGDPANGGTLLEPDGSGNYVFSEGNFNGGLPGIYIVPPANSDDDFNLNASVEFVNGSRSTTVSGVIEVVVDAVADKPGLLEAELGDVGYDGSVVVDENKLGEDFQKQDLKDGWATDTIEKSDWSGENPVGDGSGMTVTVPLEVKIVFGDYEDGSERHTALVEVPMSGGQPWTPTLTAEMIAAGVTQLPGTVTLWFDADGKFIGDSDPGYGTPKTFYQFDVPNDFIADNLGEVVLDMTFTSPEGVSFLEDSSLELEVGARAEETSISGKETNLDNNISYTFTSDDAAVGGGLDKPVLNVDSVDSTLNVKVGWAYEDHKDNQHLPDGTAYDAGKGKDFGAMYDPADGSGIETASTTSQGAPIIISIAGGDTSAAAHTESIAQISITVPGVNGEPAGTLVDGAGNALVGTANPDGSVTYTFGEGAANGLSDSQNLNNVYFRPDANNSDADVNLSYSVKVDSSSGASVIYNGTTTAVMDAVADRPVYSEPIDERYEGSNTAVAPGGSVHVEGSASFGDTDGSERHYVVVTLQNPNWSVDGLHDSSGNSLLSKNVINDYWKGVSSGPEAGQAIPDSVLNSVLTPSGNLGTDGTANDPRYMLFESVKNSNGEWEVRILADVDGDGQVDVLASGVGSVTYGGVTLTYTVDSTGKGTLSYDVTLQSDPNAIADDSATLYSKAVSVEVPGENDTEYDYANNISVVGGGDVTVHLDVVTSGLMVKFSMYEDAQDRQHLDGEAASPYVDHLGNTYASKAEFDAAHPNGLPLTFSLVELDPASGQVIVDATGPRPAEDAATDQVTQLTFNSLPTDAQGAIYYNGVEVSLENAAAGNIPGASVVGGKVVFENPDLDGFTFKPTPDFSGDVDLDVSSVITSGKSGATASQGQVLESWQDSDGVWHVGEGHLHVESVADQAQFGDGTQINAADGSASNPFDLKAADGVAEIKDNNLDGTADATGWFVSRADEDTTIKASVDLDITFTDLDRSETAMVLVEKMDGVTVVDNLGEWTDPATGTVYVIVAQGTVGTEEGDLKSGLYDLDLVISSEAKDALNSSGLKVVVRTEEDTVGHLNNSGNDVAVNDWSDTVSLGWLTGAVTVKTGWASEDNDAAKYKESGGHTLNAQSDDLENGSTSANGAPIQISVEGGTVIQVVFAYDPELGELQYNGAGLSGGTLNPETGLWEVTVNKDLLGKLTFVPKAGYSDTDIELGYTVKLQNDSGRFEVSGSTTVVVDAVADLAEVTGTATDYAGDQTAHTGAAGEAVKIAVTADFQDDGDGSERHYILVEKPGAGWEAGEGGEACQIWVSKATGAPVQPIGVDADGNFLYDTATAEPKDYFRYEVTGQEPGDNGYEVTIIPPAHSGDGNYNIKTGTLVEETVKPADAADGNYEYDYSNNIAVDLDQVTVKINVLDSGLAGSAREAYEDLMRYPTSAPDAGNRGLITLNIGAKGDETTNSGEYLDVAAGKNVVLTFEFTGDPDLLDSSQPGCGFFTVGDQNFYAEPVIVDGQVTHYTVTIPASAFGEADSVDQLPIYYTPPHNDDHDLTSINVSVPVRSEGSGLTETLDTTIAVLEVDAVADMPLNVSGSMNAGDALQHFVNDPSSWSKNSSWAGSTGYETTTIKPNYSAERFEFRVSASAQFTDLDGSEEHYLLVQRVNANWSVTSSAEELAAMGLQLVLGSDGKPLLYTDSSGSYFQFKALDNSAGTVAGEIKLGSPALTGDTNVSIKTGGLSVESNFAEGSDVKYDNNEAFKPGNTVTAVVDAVQSTLMVKAGWAPEDNNAAQHTADGSYAPVPGGSSSGYGAVGSNARTADGEAVAQGTNLAKIQLTLSSSQDHFNKITFTYNEADGDFVYRASSNYTVQSTTVDGVTTVTITYTDSSKVYNEGSNFFFRPSGNNSDADVPVRYQVEVEGRDGNTVVYEGSSKVTVDAVADMPRELNVLDDGAYLSGTQLAAAPGENVRVTVGNVKFNDYQDGSENHYLLVGKQAVHDGDQTTSVGLAEQTITITANAIGGGTVTLVIVIGEDAAHSSISINGAAPVTMTQDQWDSMMSGDGDYYRIPVDNDFLKLTENGSVSTSIDIVAPSPDADTNYTVKVGACAEEESLSGREVDLNNNKAVVVEDVAFEVDVVTSKVTISMLDDRVYENGQPRSSGQDSSADRDNDVGGFIFGGIRDGVFVPGLTNGKGEYTASEWLPGGHYDAEGNLVITNPEGIKAACAEMRINDLHDGEQANLTFTMSGPDLAEGKDYGSLWLEIDGTLTKVGEFSYDPISGEVTCSISVDGLDGDAAQSLYFLPGVNYDSNNISLDWQGTVTDLDSGHTVPAYDADTATPPALGIVVDAVANEAVLGERSVDGNDYNLDDGTFYAQSAGKIAMEVSATFHDTDGSELHYILVEAVRGVDLHGDFYKDFKSAGCDFKDSNNLHYEFDADGNVIKVFYKVPTALADNDKVAEYFEVTENQDGSTTVVLEVDLSFDGKDKDSFEISTGAMTIDEDPDAQVGDYYDKQGNYVSQNLSESKSNDVSVVIEDPVKIYVSQATATAQTPDAWVYEDDRPNANTLGPDAPQKGGQPLNVKFTPGQSDYIGSDEDHGDDYVTITYPDGRGSITYIDGDGKTITVKSGDSVLLGADGRPLYPLTFTPADGVYDDSDINIRYTLTVTDSKSGDSHDVSFNQKVYFDAVAQKPVPGAVDYEGDAKNLNFDQYSEGHKVNLSVTFTDMDGYSDHFILVEYKAGWQLEIGGQAVTTTVIGPDGKVYWQIEVTEEMIKAGVSDAEADSCTVNIDVTLTTPVDVYGDRWINNTTGEVTRTDPGSAAGWTLLTGNNSGDIQYGGMSRDNTEGDKELTWNNNWAFDVSGQIDVDYNLPGGGHGTWDIEPAGPAFENDTPLAHTGNDVKMGGTEILITGEAEGKDMTFAYDDSHGTLEYLGDDGQRHTVAPGETYNTDLGPIYYVPRGDSYSDADVPVTVTIPGLGSATITVIVDAVAQAPDNVAAGVNGNAITDDDGKTTVYTGETAEIVISGHIPDTDGSEEHFVLISKEALLGGEDGTKTSISIDGYEMIQVDGEAYYKVPIGKGDVDDDGNFSIKVNVTTSNGENDYRLTYGVGSIERPADGEISADNNLALDINGTVDFYVALANTTVTMVNVPDAVESHSGQQEISTGLVVNVGDHDVVDSLTINVSGGGGTLRIYYLDENGDRVSADLPVEGGKVLISADQSDPDFREVCQDILDMLNSGKGSSLDLVFVPDQYENQDVKISASVEAHDERSGDSGGGSASSQIDIDALATAPVLGSGDKTYADGAEAAQVGATVDVALTVTFNDINAAGTDSTPEFHYILVESKANWDYPDGLVKTYDQNRTEFLKVPVDEAIQYCHANKVGSFTDDATGIVYQVTFNKDGSATVTAQVPVGLPEVDRPGDHSYSLKYGGQTVDTPYDDDNQSIYNDVNFNTKGEVTIDVGVVDSNNVSAGASEVAEHQATGGEPIEISFTADGANDVVQTVFINPADVTNGSLRVEIGGVEQNLENYLVDGFYALPADADISFVPDAYWSGDFDIPFTATVVDGKSGAGNSTIYDGSISINVTGVDSMPDAVSATGPSFTDGYQAAQGGAEVAVAITATFPDNDGSEWHYVLVEQVDGWDCPDADGTYTDENGVSYWKVLVEEGNGEAQAEGSNNWNVTLVAPDGGADASYEFKTGALASETELPENAGTGAFAPGNDLNIDVANVSSGADAADITLGTGREDPANPDDPAAANADRAQLTIGVNPANMGPSDELQSLSIKVPAGCKVFDAAGYEVQPVDGSITLDVTAAGNGGYYFEAGANQSGSFEIEITYNFRDSTSGATDSATVTRDVTITPTTDIPGALEANNGQPTVAAGHTATVTVNMAADFKDMDGSEQHFFLVKAPVGVSAPAGWAALEESDPIFQAMEASGKAVSGESYYIYNLEANESSVSPSFTVNADYAGEAISYVAGSYETADGAGGGGKHDDAGYVFTTGSVDLVGVHPGEFNLQPAVSGGNAAAMSDALRHADVTVTGKLGFADDDSGDVANIQVTALGHGETTGAVLGEGQDYAGWLAVKGSFGTLYVNPADGAFEYKLDAGLDPATLAPESFDITIDDRYGAANSANSSSITISFDTPNNKPEATGELVKTAGGGNEGQADKLLISGEMELRDSDAGDVVSITGVAGVTEKTSGEDGSFFEVNGAFGKLRVFEDGRYEYRLENEHATGTERFTVNFQDQFSAFGGMAAADIVINVTPINHAPLVEIAEKAFDADSGSFILGQINISDIDLARQGDSLSVTVTAMGQTHEVPASGWSEVIETEYGSLKINLEDGQYMYSPNDENAAPHLDVWDNAVLTVTDQGGLSHSASLSVKLGEPENGINSIFGGDVGGELRGLDGHDNLIYGGDGVDRIYGGDGNDTLYGGAGEDIIYTGAGNNVVYGGEGDDVIHVGTGANELHGGEGGDVFVWSEFGGEDTIMDFDFNSSPGAGDQLGFKDIFGNEAGNGVDSLLKSTLDVLGTPPNTFTFGDEEGGRTITAQFNSNKELTLTLQNGADDAQVININAASGSEFYSQGADLSEESARIILEAIIKGDM